MPSFCILPLGFLWLIFFSLYFFLFLHPHRRNSLHVTIVLKTYFNRAQLLRKHNYFSCSSWVHRSTFSFHYSKRSNLVKLVLALVKDTKYVSSFFHQYPPSPDNTILAFWPQKILLLTLQFCTECLRILSPFLPCCFVKYHSVCLC